MTTTREDNRARGPLDRFSTLLSTICVRWIPDPWVIVVLLTIVAGAASFLLTPGGLGLDKAETLVRGWGDGFWDLLQFGMQMALMLLSGYVVASSPPVRRGLIWVADREAGPKRTVATVALTSMILMWIHWGIGLIAAGILVRYYAARNTKADYRLLVAAAYLGMAGTFHAGLSSSAGLLVATPGHFAEEYFGIIPMSQTVFSPFNLALVAITIVAWTITAVVLQPSPQDTVSAPEEVRAQIVSEFESEREAQREAATEVPRTPAEIIENSRWINGTIGVLGLAYIVLYFGSLEGGILQGLTLNSVNFIFLFLGILMHGTPKALLTAAQTGGSFVWGVLLQFPFYAGILGMLVASGLSERLASWFQAIANEHTYPLFIYWYSGIVNFFVPSGGSKFAIEAPYIGEAAQALNVPLDLTVVAYIWGDMSTNALQPFWALPLLALCGLSFRHIMGFLVIFALVTCTIGTAAFILAPLFF
ncbi:short-chain fatty acid transporter [Mycolicibacterium murale]|uniref:Short-chain fatty acid transporter n=1 Tax=Mycolicibacterium murale TaxID=182220 RepID=A0A7I9WV71_9MYCO|nr:TIGR00366 family protein [Mycolicibacterium murale]MCV7181826.1 short-chain fatty acid transporter [Mycolicibacterium murale]GFG61591.1 short-chain fatty acid transporter [Mycolicibacterium murale]